MLIAISTYLKPLSEIDPYRTRHLDFLKKLATERKVLVAGRQDPGIGGIIVANMNSIDDFRELLQGDPYFQNGFVEYKFIKFLGMVYDENIKDICC